MQTALEDKSIKGCTHGAVVKLVDAVETRSMSAVDRIVREIHDIFESYYHVARQRFVDNVWMQAANHHLVAGPDTPLKIFSPSFVHRLTADQLEEIAGEDAVLKRKRTALVKEIENLEAGKKILGHSGGAT